MANNFLQYSEILEGLTKEEAQWCAKLLGLAGDPTDSSHFDDEGNPETELAELARTLWPDGEPHYNTGTIEERENATWGVWFYSEEGDEPYIVGQIVQEFLKKFRPGKGLTWKLEWATWCSRPRIGEFGGGVMLVTEHKILLKATEDLAEDMKKNPELFK